MQKEKVIILRKIKFAESDLIVHAINQKGARIDFIARAALKSKKRFGGGVLEPMNYIRADYKRKNNFSSSGMQSLNEAELLDSFPKIKESIEKIELGLFMLSVLSKISKEEMIDGANVFNLLGNSLKALEVSSSIEKLKVQFLMKLLSYQGVLGSEFSDGRFLEVSVMDHEKVDVSLEEINRLERKLLYLFESYLEQ